VDRSVVIEKAFNGYAKALPGPPLIPPFWAGNGESYYTYDVNKAKQLLAAAGYPNGFTMTMLVSPATTYHPPLAAVVQSEWKKIGVEVKIENVDTAVANARAAANDFESWPLRWWGSDFIDPDGALRPTFACGGSKNGGRYCNKAVDDLLNKGLTTTDPKQRAAIYRDAMKIIGDEQPWILLVSFDRYQAMAPYVRGYVAYPNGSQYSFREVWLDK
jgi:ABC-type transport system substrate-binding protein